MRRWPGRWSRLDRVHSRRRRRSTARSGGRGFHQTDGRRLVVCAKRSAESRLSASSDFDRRFLHRPRGLSTETAELRRQPGRGKQAGASPGYSLWARLTCGIVTAPRTMTALTIPLKRSSRFVTNAMTTPVPLYGDGGNVRVASLCRSCRALDLLSYGKNASSTTRWRQRCQERGPYPHHPDQRAKRRRSSAGGHAKTRSAIQPEHRQVQAGLEAQVLFYAACAKPWRGTGELVCWPIKERTPLTRLHRDVRKLDGSHVRHGAAVFAAAPAGCSRTQRRVVSVATARTARWYERVFAMGHGGKCRRVAVPLRRRRAPSRSSLAVVPHVAILGRTPRNFCRQTLASLTVRVDRLPGLPPRVLSPALDGRPPADRAITSGRVFPNSPTAPQARAGNVVRRALKMTSRLDRERVQP